MNDLLIGASTPTRSAEPKTQAPEQDADGHEFAETLAGAQAASQAAEDKAVEQPARPDNAVMGQPTEGDEGEPETATLGLSAPSRQVANIESTPRATSMESAADLAPSRHVSSQGIEGVPLTAAKRSEAAGFEAVAVQDAIESASELGMLGMLRPEDAAVFKTGGVMASASRPRAAQWWQSPQAANAFVPRQPAAHQAAQQASLQQASLQQASLQQASLQQAPLRQALSPQPLASHTQTSVHEAENAPSPAREKAPTRPAIETTVSPDRPSGPAKGELRPIEGSPERPSPLRSAGQIAAHVLASTPLSLSESLSRRAAEMASSPASGSADEMPETAEAVAKEPPAATVTTATVVRVMGTSTTHALAQGPIDGAPTTPLGAPVESVDVHAEASAARLERQQVAAEVTGHMTLRRGGEAEIDMGDWGRVRIGAHSHRGAVDVSIVAQSNAAQVLQAAEPELWQSLRQADVDVSRVSIEQEPSDAQQQSTRGQLSEQSSDRRSPSSAAHSSPDHREAATAEVPSSRVRSGGRVRVVM